MKKYNIIFALIIGIIAVACSTSKRTSNVGVAKDKPLVVRNYDMPDDSLTMPTQQKKDFVESCERGIILYNTICASCHNKLIDGKSVVPDFSLPQLMDYEIRIQYPSHEDRLKENNLSVQELDDVVNYLRYKKKSGVNF